MTEWFGFDPKILSNDELYNKQVELIRRKTLAARLGRMDSANQLDVLVQAIDMERRERMFLDRFNSLPSSPVVIETDPELREQGTTNEEAQKPVQSTRPIRRTVRSATPILPDGD